MINVPCMNCENRHQSCHSTCKQYLDFKKEKEIEHKSILKIRNENEDWYGYKQTKFKAIKKYRKR